MDTRLVESMGTYKTFLRLKEGFSFTIPYPAIVAKDPSAIVIFLLLGYELCVLNFCDECVIWLIAPESIIQEPKRDMLEALKA